MRNPLILTLAAIALVAAFLCAGYWYARESQRFSFLAASSGKYPALWVIDNQAKKARLFAGDGTSGGFYFAEDKKPKPKPPTPAELAIRENLKRSMQNPMTPPRVTAPQPKTSTPPAPLTP